jgi:endo-1,4-beta-xylanase
MKKKGVAVITKMSHFLVVLALAIIPTGVSSYAQKAKPEAPTAKKKAAETKQGKKEGQPDSFFIGPWVDVEIAPAGMVYKTFYSAILKKEVSYLIYLPAEYEKETQRRFPVVYWLHGSGGSQKAGDTFVRALQQARLANEACPMIVVSVNGLRHAFYVDSLEGDRPLESVITQNLIPHIDATYRTISKREGRGVEGHSMGGYGAAHLGFKYPEIFGVVSISSPALVHPNVDSEMAVAAFNFIFGGRMKELYIPNDPFVLLEQNAQQIRGRTIIRLVHGDKEQEWALKRWKALHELMNSLNVSHELTVVEDMPTHSFAKHVEKVGPKYFEFFRKAFANLK